MTTLKKKEMKVKKKCSYCKKIFYVYPCRLRGEYPVKFCSIACRASSSKKPPSVEFVCPICKKLYLLTKKQAKNGQRKYCSMICRNKAFSNKRGKLTNGWKGGRINFKGYIYKYSPEHPNKTCNNYVMEQRLVMEDHIGRHLFPGEIVHHKNGIKDDNKIGNLEIRTLSSHMKSHYRNREINQKGQFV